MTAAVDILIPTCNRPDALAVTLTALLGQTFDDFAVLISDQSDGSPSYESPCAQAVLRVLNGMGRRTRTWRNLPRRGLAQQRQALLEASDAGQVLFLDDDVILAPPALERMHDALQRTGCGFVANAVIGLSYRDDVRPHQQAIEFWPEDRVLPEHVTPDSPAWLRHAMHNAANLWHVQERLPLPARGWRAYKVAWAGGCVLFDRQKLQDCGGFSFWTDVPEQHCGEDVYAQLRVMARYGGCGIIPSGAFHQELPTTVTDREVDLPRWVAGRNALPATGPC